MALLEMNFRPTARQLRQFGLIALVALPALAWLWGGGRTAISLSVAIGAVMATLGLFWPRGLAPAFIGLSFATIPIGIVVGEAALALVYYAIITPIGRVMRLISRDPLEREIHPEADTYWQPKPPPRGPRSYLRPW